MDGGGGGTRRVEGCLAPNQALVFAEACLGRCM